MTLLDSLQESILREEVNKLERDDRIVTEFDSLLEELLNSLRADNQYTAERVYLDTQVKLQVYGSAKAVELNEQLILLKAKQKQLANHTLDPLKEGLQVKFDDEDNSHLESYGFPNDHPDLPVAEFVNITAEPINRYVPGHHCKLSDFLNVYLVQPWMVEQSTEDVRFEEQIAAKQLGIGTLREQVKRYVFVFVLFVLVFVLVFVFVYLYWFMMFFYVICVPTASRRRRRSTRCAYKTHL
jgi:hypothetical protein